MQQICHSDQGEAVWRNLRIRLTFAVKSVRRSFDALRLLRMTTAYAVIMLCALIKANNNNRI